MSQPSEGPIPALAHNGRHVHEMGLSSGVRLKVALLGVFALSLGVLIYLFERPAGSLYLLSSFLPRFGGLDPWLGSMGGWLPDFLHPLAFSLLTAALLGITRFTAVVGSAAWWLTDSLFEIGQHPALSSGIAAAMPSWTDGVPVLGNAAAYFFHGTYDPWDLVAIAAGAAGACFLLLSIHYRGHHHAASL